VAIVTLTTDFGTADGYVGAMKGVVLGRAPGAIVVDLAHDIPRHDVAAAAFALAQAAPHFPAGTVHVAVVDPGVGTGRAAVIVDDGRSLYVGPDNGVFSLVAPAPRAAYAIEAAAFRREAVSATFHGRDLFAAAAGSLAAGAPAAAAGPAVTLAGALEWPPAPAAPPGARAARVVHVDAFGNLITDLDVAELPPAARVSVAGRSIAAVSHTYGDVARGALCAYVGSANTLEIAVREGDAAAHLGVGRGAVVLVEAGAKPQGGPG
jgi:S-adenosyl-L-methionine hydrolase (adenosine-forming)